MKKLDQKGSHALVVVLVVVVVAVVGAVGWYVWNKQKGGSSSSSVSNAIKEAAKNCDLDDKDICKFFASWKENKYYTVDTTSTSGGKNTTMKMEYVAPDRYHMVMTGELAFETISIGNVTYTKASDGVWYKQTQKKEDVDKYKSESNADFEEPKKDEAPEKKTTYKLITKEACGNLTCFKYQVISPESKDTTEYIWFDTKDYQLRKTSTEMGADKSTSTFSYNKLEIKEPSPVKELGPNQVIIPGQGVVDVPSATDLGQ